MWGLLVPMNAIVVMTLWGRHKMTSNSMDVLWIYVRYLPNMFPIRTNISYIMFLCMSLQQLIYNPPSQGIP